MLNIKTLNIKKEYMQTNIMNIDINIIQLNYSQRTARIHLDYNNGSSLKFPGWNLMGS